MSVRSEPLPPQRRPIDWPIALAKVGLWLAVVAFGGVFFAINGGFSVIGLGVIAGSFNDAGRVFWALATSPTFALPLDVPGLPTTQPLIPWLGVVAASLLQICAIWLKLSGRAAPRWLLITAGVLSLYDVATSYFGLGTVPWIAATSGLVQLGLALVITFALEAIIGVGLARMRRPS